MTKLMEVKPEEVLNDEFYETLAADSDTSYIKEVKMADETRMFRFFGTLILSHKRGAMKAPRLKSANGKSNIPFLKNHDSDKPIGVVNKIRLDSKEKASYATVRFSKSPLAEEVREDFDDDIAIGISPGIMINELELTEKGESFFDDVYTATEWEVLEVSNAPVPANPHAAKMSFLQSEEELKGILIAARKKKEKESEEEDKEEAAARARFAQALAEEETEETTEEETTTEETEESKATGTEQASSLIETQVKLEEETPVGEENTTTVEETQVSDYVKEMLDLGKLTGQHQFAQEAIGENMPIEEFKDKLHSIQFKSQPVVDLKKLNEDSDKFDFARWLRHKSDPDNREDAKAATYDLEFLSNYNTSVKDNDRARHGSLVPFSTVPGCSGKRVELATDTTGPKGGSTIQTDVMLEDVIFPFLSQSRLIPRVTVYSGLIGNVDIPTVTTEAPAVAAAAEGAAVPATDAVFGKISLAPKTLGGRVEVTRRLMTQTNGFINSIIMEMFDRQFTDKLENALLTEIFALAGIPTETIASDKNLPTRGEVLAMREKLIRANVPLDKLWLVSADEESYLMATLKSAGVAGYMAENGMIEDIDYEVTTRLADASIFLTSPQDMVLGTWEGIDFVVNRAEDTGNFRISAWIDYDTAVKRTTSFVKGTT